MIVLDVRSTEHSLYAFKCACPLPKDPKIAQLRRVVDVERCVEAQHSPGLIQRHVAFRAGHFSEIPAEQKPPTGTHAGMQTKPKASMQQKPTST